MPTEGSFFIFLFSLWLCVIINWDHDYNYTVSQAKGDNLNSLKGVNSLFFKYDLEKHFSYQNKRNNNTNNNPQSPLSTATLLDIYVSFELSKLNATTNGITQTKHYTAREGKLNKL